MIVDMYLVLSQHFHVQFFVNVLTAELTVFFLNSNKKVSSINQIKKNVGLKKVGMESS